MERAEKGEVVEISEDINYLERLPEGCISDILSLTSPADVCRSSLFSTLFKSAADSDALSEKFLPADYQDIISRAFYPFLSVASSKKELYSRLCDYELLIDGGYPGSRFAKVAELKWVCWLEIREKLDTRLLSPKTFYAAFLVLKFKERVVYGFDYQTIKAKVEVVGRAVGNSGVCSEERRIYLVANGEHASPDPMLKGQYVARERGEGWMEVEMGHFYNEELEENEGEEVHMSVLETERLGAKYGIIVQGMELRPKVDTQIP
ncbi:hypothetical protein MKX01_040533 [Papaver californicum]|nr:hypothetical protein MKX01_040533 [Papaver californicum]